GVLSAVRGAPGRHAPPAAGGTEPSRRLAPGILAGDRYRADPGRTGPMGAENGVAGDGIPSGLSHLRRALSCDEAKPTSHVQETARGEAVPSHLLAKITRPICGGPAPTSVAPFFIFLTALLGLPLPGTAFSLQPAELGFFPSTTTTPPPGPSQSQSALAKGKFLVASRRLGDPNFAETVVLLIEYGESGAMGVSTTRPTEAPLATLLPEVKGLQQTDAVYLGGPVGRNQMIILVRSGNQPQESLQVFADVYTIAGRAALQQLIDQVGKSAKFRAYL